MAQAAIHEAKKALRRELKKRIALLTDEAKLLESREISKKRIEVMVESERSFKNFTLSSQDVNMEADNLFRFLGLSIKLIKLLEMEEYKSSRRISVYLSMPSEVQTKDILKDIFQSKKECFIPRYIGSTMDMVKMYSLEDMSTLPVTSWNIQQPAHDDEREEAISSGGLDLIVVPGLGFTRSGLRLGRGKGYYDSYIMKCIQKCNKKPLLIGLAFTTQLCDDLPVTERDMMLDHVISGDPR